MSKWPPALPALLASCAPAQLHPKGDWFLGRRLPEFDVGWRAGGQVHPLNVVGRHLTCGTHSRSVPRVLDNPGITAPCLALAREWRNAFSHERFSSLGGLTMLSSYRSGRMANIATIVKATMMDAIVRVDPELARRSFDVVSVSATTRSWVKHGEAMFEMFDYSMPSSLWGKLLDDGLDDLPRRRRILAPSGLHEEFASFWMTLPRLVPVPENPSKAELADRRERVRSLVLALDDAADDVNVWGWYDFVAMKRQGAQNSVWGFQGYEHTLFDSLPAKLTVENLREWLYRSLEDPELWNPDMWGGPLPSAGESREDVWRAKVFGGGLSMKVADEWRHQGLFEPYRVKRAVELMEAHPGLGPGRAAWYARHPQLRVQTHGVQPLYPTERKPLERGLGGRYDKVWSNHVAPADWWLRLESAHIQDEGIAL